MKKQWLLNAIKQFDTVIIWVCQYARLPEWTLLLVDLDSHKSICYDERKAWGRCRFGGAWFDRLVCLYLRICSLWYRRCIPFALSRDRSFEVSAVQKDLPSYRRRPSWFWLASDCQAALFRRRGTLAKGKRQTSSGTEWKQQKPKAQYTVSKTTSHPPELPWCRSYGRLCSRRRRTLHCRTCRRSLLFGILLSWSCIRKMKQSCLVGFVFRKSNASQCSHTLPNARFWGGSS